MQEKTNELKQTYDKLVESEKLALLGQFAAGLTHEIDNPLTIVAGRAESLLMRGNLDPKVEQALKTILSQARRAAEMTSQLLSASRPIQIHLEPLRMNALLEETLETVSYRPEFDHIHTIKEFSQDVPTVHGDHKQLIEVFSNLFNNAAQAMARGGTLRVCSLVSDSQVLVEVYDTGTGIAPENQSRLFTPFFTTKDAGKGTGLGLFLSQSIIRKHGGAISVFSEPGKGTCFTVALPLRQSEGAVPPASTMAPA